MGDARPPVFTSIIVCRVDLPVRCPCVRVGGRGDAGCLVQGSNVAARYHVCAAQSTQNPESLNLLQVEQSQKKSMTPSDRVPFSEAAKSSL